MNRNPFIDEEAFLRGYIECAIWSSNDPDTETPLDENYDAGDLDSQWEDIAREDCAVFCRNFSTQLVEFSKLTGRDAGSHGHDFWLTRNGHGAGFWDRYLECDHADRKQAEEIGNILSDACEPFGVVDLMPISDGKIG